MERILSLKYKMLTLIKGKRSAFIFDMAGFWVIDWRHRVFPRELQTFIPEVHWRARLALIWEGVKASEICL